MDKIFDNISKIADTLGILGFGVSVVTLLIAKRLKANIIEHIEKKLFAKKSINLVKDLKTIYKNIFEYNIYNSKLLYGAISIIDGISIDYTFLRKEIKTQIEAVKNKINNDCLIEINEKSGDDIRYKHNFLLCGELNKLIKLIEKEANLL